MEEVWGGENSDEPRELDISDTIVLVVKNIVMSQHSVVK